VGLARVRVRVRVRKANQQEMVGRWGRLTLTLTPTLTPAPTLALALTLALTLTRALSRLCVLPGRNESIAAATAAAEARFT